MENSKEVVLGFIKSLNNADFESARNYVSDEMVFEGVLGSRDRAEAYFKDIYPGGF